jgi:hypothetical protein
MMPMDVPKHYRDGRRNITNHCLVEHAMTGSTSVMQQDSATAKRDCRARSWRKTCYPSADHRVNANTVTVVRWRLEQAYKRKYGDLDYTRLISATFVSAVCQGASLALHRCKAAGESDLGLYACTTWSRDRALSSIANDIVEAVTSATRVS